MKLCLLLPALSLILATPAPAPAPSPVTPCPTPVDCKFDVNGTTYDLTSVQQIGTLYVKGPQADSFFLQLCGEVTSCSIPGGAVATCGCKPPGAVCQGSGGGYFNCGVCTAQTASVNAGVLNINYGSGQPCSNKVPRSTTVICQVGTGTSSLISATEGDCKYTLTLSSPDCAPAAKGGLGGGWIFVIIVLVSFTVYCLAGAIFMYTRGARGGEMLPNGEFWKELPGLMKDGTLFAKDKVFGLCGN